MPCSSFTRQIATAASVLGATVPYLVGRLGGRLLAERFVRGERIEAAEDFFKDHGAPTTFVAAFAPLPYPIFALVASVGRMGYPVCIFLVLVYVLGRYSASRFEKRRKRDGRR